ncbi:hypothetical protein [Crassaminicella profunda]|uniref:hypothetical protein n=1 Tax=Crassaminicella profunda TaxID=1286698 RepID=UPI001CA79BF0|nr:hypothetical protein [Crassaminicella profunda]QZY56222.1 hypothetical protein K7H06_04335 [Crassaminicella profunda]
MSRRFINLQKNIHQIKLQQMGAHVEVIEGVMHFVRVQIEDTIIKYVYHINDKGDYFLQRRCPYPLNFGTYPTQDNVINIIQHDILQMKNAKKSKKFQQFIEINKSLTHIAKDFEELYLYYNVSGIQAKKINEKINELKKELIETKNISTKIHFEKDPDTIK